MDGVGKIAEGVLQALRLLGRILILIGHAGGGDGHDPDIVVPQLGTQGVYIAVALVVQPEVGRAAPELDLPDAQALLAVQEIVQREAAVVLVHIDQLAALDPLHAPTSPHRAARARSSG